MSEIAGGRNNGVLQRVSRSLHDRVAKTARGRLTDPTVDPITAIIPFDRHGDRYLYYRSCLRTITDRQWALAGSGWITLLCMECLPPGSLLRTMVVFGFVLFCPGFAVAGLVPTHDAAERWVLAVALSMSLGLLVSVTFTVARDDSVALRIGTLALITTTAVIADAVGSPPQRNSFTPTDAKGPR
jgi:hypothetical protein